MTDTITLVDGHVHVHGTTDVAALLESAWNNFTVAAHRLGARRWSGALLLAEMKSTAWFDAMSSGRHELGGWTLAPDPVETVTLRAINGERQLLLVAGRQLVTAEGIEVLSLGTRTQVADGQDFETTVAASGQVAALTVLPWGAGKWLGARGRRVTQALADHAALIPGDNGGRPWFWPESTRLPSGSAASRAVVNGTDPLPLPGEEKRVGSFGSWFAGTLPVSEPAAHLLTQLRTLTPALLHPYGSHPGPVAFLRAQLGLRLHPSTDRPGASVSSQSSPETPDIETSSAGYARRFAGAAGRYLLAVQSRSIRAALRGLPPGRALDVGGGHGQLVDLLRELGWQVTVHGTDPQCETNLRELHGKRDCEFLRGDLFALPVPDHSFDLVIAVRLISHVDAWPKLVTELCRVSRGAVVIDYPAKSALNALTPLLFGLKKSLEGNTRTYTSFSKAQLCAEFGRHGFGAARQVKQFFMPMVVHRVGKAILPLRAAEQVFRLTGLTAAFGSPVILRVDRQ